MIMKTIIKVIASKTGGIFCVFFFGDPEQKPRPGILKIRLSHLFFFAQSDDSSPEPQTSQSFHSLKHMIFCEKTVKRYDHMVLNHIFLNYMKSRCWWSYDHMVFRYVQIIYEHFWFSAMQHMINCHWTFVFMPFDRWTLFWQMNTERAEKTTNMEISWNLTSNIEGQCLWELRENLVPSLTISEPPSSPLHSILPDFGVFLRYVLSQSVTGPTVFEEFHFTGDPSSFFWLRFVRVSFFRHLESRSVFFLTTLRHLERKFLQPLQ